MPRRTNRLSASLVATAQPNSHGRRSRLIHDGNGLYLQVAPAGTRSFAFRYTINGRTRLMGLGSVTITSLSSARKRALELKVLVASGTDPLGQRAVTAVARQEPQVHRMTFQRAAEIYIETHAPSWSNAKHASQWSNSLRDHAHPIIGKLPVDAITVDHIRRILKPIWNTKNETASRVRGRIERILGWASVRGYRTGENPARWQGFLSEDFPKRSRAALPKHHAALPYAEAPAFYKHLTSVGGVSPQFLRFIMLTAVRTGEAQKVRWDEIDFEAKLWTVPALRMKAKREHRVPLSEEAIALLLSVRAAQQLTPEVVESPYVFVTTKADKPISNMAALALLKRLGRTDITPHGMRSTFRDWAAEQTDHAREVAEAALAHTLTNRVEAAYQRGDLLEKRQKLMKDWARFLTR